MTHEDVMVTLVVAGLAAGFTLFLAGYGLGLRHGRRLDRRRQADLTCSLRDCLMVVGRRVTFRSTGGRAPLQGVVTDIHDDEQMSPAESWLEIELSHPRWWARRLPPIAMPLDLAVHLVCDVSPSGAIQGESLVSKTACKGAQQT